SRAAPDRTPKAIRKTDAIKRYGFAAVRKVEPPAKPAAITYGKTGRQQLDAARMLPIAARLATIVDVPLPRLGSVVLTGMSRLSSVAQCSRASLPPESLLRW